MDKFNRFSAMTNDYLDGRLTGMVINYIDSNRIDLVVSYKYNNYFTIDYEIEVDLEKEKVKFLSHGSDKIFEKIRLNDEPLFDEAVKSYFFS